MSYGKPVGPGGCQIKSVSPARSCRRTASRVRTTGLRLVNLCRRHDERYGAMIGTLMTEDRTIGRIAGEDVIVTDFKRPEQKESKA